MQFYTFKPCLPDQQLIHVVSVLTASGPTLRSTRTTAESQVVRPHPRAPGTQPEGRESMPEPETSKAPHHRRTKQMRDPAGGRMRRARTREPSPPEAMRHQDHLGRTRRGVVDGKSRGQAPPACPRSTGARS